MLVEVESDWRTWSIKLARWLKKTDCNINRYVNGRYRFSHVLEDLILDGTNANSDRIVHNHYCVAIYRELG